jgi:hypothetical protein
MELAKLGGFLNLSPALDQSRTTLLRFSRGGGQQNRMMSASSDGVLATH